MATIKEVLDNARNASQNARGVTLAILQDHEDIITGYNKDQLIHGQDRDDEKLHPYRSILYAIEKNNKNPLAGFGTADLNLTGAFYRGFFLSISGDSFSIDSTDSKSDDLRLKYGSMIHGLSKNNITLYSKNEFFDEFKAFIEKTLKINMK